MMNNNREFDQWQKLKQHESPVSDKAWANIAANLPQPQKKKRFTFGLILAIIIALLLLTLYLLLPPNDKNPENNIKNGNKTENFKQETLKHAQIDLPVEDNNNKQNTTVAEAVSQDVQQDAQPDDSNSSSNHNYKAFLNKNTTKHSITRHSSTTQLPRTSQLPIVAALNTKAKDRTSLQDQITTLAPLSPSSFNVSRDTRIPLNAETIFSQNVINDCFPVKSNTWFIELYFSPDYANKFLYGDNTEFINSRLGTESALFSFSSGVRIGYKLKNNLIAKTGLNYTKINEKFHQTIKNIIKKKVIIEIDTIKNPDGTQTIKRDTTVKVVYGTEDIQKLNTYSMVCIPVLLSYEFNKRNNHNLAINAGVLFNIISKQNGIILNSQGKLDTFNNINNKIFTKNVGISLYASFYYGYSIEKDIELFVEPKFRYYLKSFTLADYPLEQKYIKYGISLGSRYFFY